jgi:hypothetical protein
MLFPLSESRPLSDQAVSFEVMRNEGHEKNGLKLKDLIPIVGIPEESAGCIRLTESGMTSVNCRAG